MCDVSRGPIGQGSTLIIACLPGAGKTWGGAGNF